jgi:MSHA pilin protein MshD
MTPPAPKNDKTGSQRRAFSLLEVVISVFLVGTVMVVALEALVAATAGRAHNGNQAQATLLAQALIEEILDQPYVEPDDGALFGPESGEAVVGGTRADFDDVDDYHGWSGSPPQTKDGTDLSLTGNWRREVSVEWVTADDIEVNSTTDLGLKSVLVSVEYEGEPMASLSVVVTRSRQVLPLEEP